MTTRATVYVRAVMQCALWVAKARECAERSGDLKLAPWQRGELRATAWRACVDADGMSRELFGRNATDLV